MASKPSKRAIRRQAKKLVIHALTEAARVRSAQKAPERSRWDELPAGERELLERHDNFAPFRNKIREVAQDRGEWAGIPMPLDDAPLVIEPRYPRAAELMAIGRKPEPEDRGDLKIRNTFWSGHYRSEIVVIEKPNGRVTYGLIPCANHMDMVLTTLGCSDAWGIEQEARALELLGTLLRHRQFKQYLLTGTFLESSERSGVTYMFRKLRPTIALRKTPKNRIEIMCALCMHPIGLYERSFAGAMCATDDVVAHLMLMRADEHLYWKRSTQHAGYRPEAGI